MCAAIRSPSSHAFFVDCRQMDCRRNQSCHPVHHIQGLRPAATPSPALLALFFCAAPAPASAAIRSLSSHEILDYRRSRTRHPLPMAGALLLEVSATPLQLVFSRLALAQVSALTHLLENHAALPGCRRKQKGHRRARARGLPIEAARLPLPVPFFAAALRLMSVARRSFANRAFSGCYH